MPTGFTNKLPETKSSSAGEELLLSDHKMTSSSSGGYVMETSVWAEPAGKVIRCRKGVEKRDVIGLI